MTIEEIQRALQTICLERSGTHPDAEMVGMFAALESCGLKDFKPAPGRATLTFASFSFEDQEKLEKYAERLINEAHASLCAGVFKRDARYCARATMGRCMTSNEFTKRDTTRWLSR